MPITETAVDPELIAAVTAVFADHFDVLVHNDDVTTFETVITALVTIFDHTTDRAVELAWVVHRRGEAVVATLPRDEAESGVAALHSFRIQASMRPAGT
jgi:ATP-dependent Clp protease adaptor protein ClpS